MTTQASQAGAAPVQPASGNTFAMVRTLAGIALISGCLLSLVYQMTSERIARNTEARVRNAVLELLPGATRQKTFEFTGINETGTEMPFTVYAGYDIEGKFVGVALEASDQGGYGGEIRLLYGYLPDKEQIIGMKVLLSKETPGLGDKIKTDEAFQANFSALQVPLNNDKSTLAHTLVYAKPDSGGSPGEIEGISGATISSKAVVRALRYSAEMALPVVQKRLNELKETIL